MQDAHCALLMMQGSKYAEAYQLSSETVKQFYEKWVYTSLVKPLVSMLLLVVVIDNVNMLGQESLGGVSYTVNRLSKEKNLSVYESFLLLTKVAIICTGWNSSLEAIFYYNRVDLKGLSFKFPTTIILYELLNLVVVIDNVKMLG
ncbi:hypothetical protein V6N11_016187 [Hibiscus sabdariffa]|uniref:Uncharacterized protein n=1 Tax=Hibiscus sabdariffa TaxID=183260 RepID=A0ABR2TUU9_9ROSI